MTESLFLEDLNLRHFGMVNLHREPITIEHISLVMQALGKFHALSFAVKDQQPEKFKQLKQHLVCEQYWTNLETDFKKIFMQLLTRLITCLEEENRSDLLEKFKRVTGDDVVTTVYGLVSGASAEPYAVICHGDLTTNNSMFRKDEQGKPIGIQLFDFQFSRYGSPVTDLVLYLFCSTTKELRDKHYEDFLKIYHDSLSDLLSR